MRKEGLVPNTGKYKTDLQLDHIIPYKQGFELNISPEIIGGRKNLRFILGEENRKKWDSFQPDNVVQSIIGE
jgi:5-methylcytosine-specific restriction endonuclease McrA